MRRAGSRPGKVASLTVIAGMTFWLGMALVLAASLMWQADELSLLIYTNIRINQLIGLAAAALIVAYFVWVSLKRRSVKIQGWRLELPGFRLSLAQMLIGAADVCAGAGVLYVLLPGGHGIAFETFLAVYVFAVMLGVASHSPGGLGVFEATILLALSNYPREPVLGALLLFAFATISSPSCSRSRSSPYEILGRLTATREVFGTDEGIEIASATTNPDFDMAGPPDDVRGSQGRAPPRGDARRPSRDVVLIAVALARGAVDAWLLLSAALAVAASALVFADRGRPRAIRGAGSSEAAPSGFADAVLANVPDPVILVDRRVLVLEANAAARRLLSGLKVKHPLSFALRSPDVLAASRRCFDSGEAVKVEYAERIPTERTFEVHIGPLREPGGEAGQSGVVLFFRDLTSARRLESMRVDFVANASHELRTPLASLLGFIETLQGSARNDPAARERFLEIMRGQAQRMTRLIDDLLSLSRIEMRAHLPPETPIDLVPLVGQMVDTLSPLVRERGMSVDLALPDPPLVVLGDRDELLRAVENLIENAVKYGAQRRPYRSLPRPPRRGRAARSRAFRARRRPRHRARAPAAPDGALLPGRRGEEPREGRHRPRPRHRQAHRQPPSRPALDRKHARGGRDVQIVLPEAAEPS